MPSSRPQHGASLCEVETVPARSVGTAGLRSFVRGQMRPQHGGFVA